MSQPLIAQATWEWLARLHTATAGGSTAAEAEARIALVAPMIASRFPAEAFTRRSLEHVAAGCRFWPAYGELVTLLGEWWRDNRPDQARLTYSGPTYIPEGRAPPDEAEKATVHATVQGLLAELAAKRQADPPLPPLADVTLQGEALRRSRQARGIVAPVVADQDPSDASSAPDNSGEPEEC